MSPMYPSLSSLSITSIVAVRPVMFARVGEGYKDQKPRSSSAHVAVVEWVEF